MSDGLPIIIVNLKAYEEGYGADGYDLCKIMEEIAIEHNVNLAAAVSAIDLVDFSDNLKIPIFAQHVDGVNYGSHTGSILPEADRYSGAVGTLVNMAPHPCKGRHFDNWQRFPLFVHPPLHFG